MAGQNRQARDALAEMGGLGGIQGKSIAGPHCCAVNNSRCCMQRHTFKTDKGWHKSDKCSSAPCPPDGRLLAV